MSAKAGKKNSLLNADIAIGRVKFAEKILFAKHLAVMLKSGLTISEAMTIIHAQAKGRLRKTIGEIKNSIESGNSLSSSMAKFPKIFSPMFISTTYVGESSGTLDENLENIAEHLKKDKELIDTIRGAMFYPMIVLILASVLGLVIAFVILPKITPMFEGLKVDLPASTKVLIWFSGLVEERGATMLIALVGSIFLLFWLARRKFSRPVTNYITLHIPLIKNISINRNLAVFCATLGTLLKSGLYIDEALNIAKDTVSNYYFQKSLLQVKDKVRQGTELSENLAKYGNLFPGLATGMIRVGEKSGKLEETLFYLAEYYESEVNQTTKKLSTAIEPLLLIFIGLVVGGLAISIITPIYELTGNVDR